MLNTRFLSTIAASALIALPAVAVNAEQIFEIEETTTTQEQPLPLEQRAQISYDAYILGPGDGLRIELLDLPELSGTFAIGPDGTIYIPRLRALYVEGLTVEELRYFLTEQFRTYVRNPQVYVRPIKYRPIRVYVGGEVRRPGYYTLSGVQTITEDVTSTNLGDVDSGINALGEGVTSKRSTLTSGGSSGNLFPTVFDAIRTAQGITPYSKLSEVQVTRRRAQGLGGGRIRTNLDFLSLITEGNESQNIRLFDGDVLNIAKSPVVLREQLLKAGQSNLSPQFLEVFVTGRVNIPGGITVPQGSSLNQAISLAGGAKLLKGKVEFVRFNRDGTIDRRLFAYQPAAAADAPNNPILAAGDLIRVQDSLLSGSVSVLNELTGPFVGLYSVYSLFN
ncbi:polysaccharide biosynthesis/export family protein [Synechococcus sp. MIT S9504]|uniref:polysaccharide biosynthesis/export family protein n=1 Tax=Synechococcus sp. MIT S9504 TaxID=1801628 RepID=UPI0007BB58FD|nr:polysaccharide biosynthesis/export family protein [Synechococcus sp. MIT S9504]KZR85023.1 Polysialic acid transport protein KpsD precursor [Synechococcus sp. MIT S9504]